MAKRNKPTAGAAVISAEGAGVPPPRSGEVADFPVVCGGRVFIVIQHLDSRRTGVMPERLRRVTAGRVKQAFSWRRGHGQAIEYAAI